MRWTEASFRTSPDKIDELCEVLTGLGAEGFIVEDERDFRRFVEENGKYWGCVDEKLEEHYRGLCRVRLYVPDDEGGRELLAKYERGTGIEADTSAVDDADWENNWKKYYSPMEIGRKLLILPAWEPIPEDCGRRIVRLDPGPAFGTGGHASTRMCLEVLEEISGPGRFVLDLGCGSGILGIAALALGCGYAAGCDVDPIAPEAAETNAKLNGIGAGMFRMLAGDVLADPKLREELGEGYDIVLANIVADVIIPLAPLAARFKTKDGLFVCSGIIEGMQEKTEEALKAAGMEIISHREDSGWHCFTAK